MVARYEAFALSIGCVVGDVVHLPPVRERSRGPALAGGRARRMLADDPNGDAYCWKAMLNFDTAGRETQLTAVTLRRALCNRKGKTCRCPMTKATRRDAP